MTEWLTLWADMSAGSRVALGLLALLILSLIIVVVREHWRIVRWCERYEAEGRDLDRRVKDRALFFDQARAEMRERLRQLQGGPR